MASLLFLLASVAGCSFGTEPSTAVTLRLLSVDGRSLPASLGTGSAQVTVPDGVLIGTDRGPACGYAVRVITGERFVGEVPNCTLRRTEEKTVSFGISDPAYPAGAHTYRFAP